MTEQGLKLTYTRIPEAQVFPETDIFLLVKYITDFVMVAKTEKSTTS